MTATYQPFDLAAIQQVLRPDQGWTPAEIDSAYPAKEHVLDWIIPDGPAAGLALRVFTSVQITSGWTRPSGADAIRICVPKRLKSVKVYRTEGWQKRLVTKARDVLAKIQEMEAERAAKKAAAVVEQRAHAKADPTDYTVPAAFLERAASNGLKYPKITLSGDGVTVRFSLAGPKSQYHGQVMVTDDGAFHFRKWFGRIKDGQWIRPKLLPENVASLVQQFCDDPIATVVELGKKTGHCQFCMKHLETVESVSAGYGPVCAKNYGLPWGGKENI